MAREKVVEWWGDRAEKALSDLLWEVASLCLPKQDICWDKEIGVQGGNKRLSVGTRGGHHDPEGIILEWFS